MKHLFVLFLLIPFVSFSADDEIRRKEGEIKVELGILIPRYEFEIVAPESASKNLASLKPHNPSRTSVGFGYRNLSATVSFANPNSEETKALYGNSKSDDYRLRFFGRHTYEFFYQYYKGYYVDNSKELDPSYIGRKDRILRPDIRTQNWGATYYYSWHEPDFSQAVAFDQIVPAPKSGWGTSWFLHGSRSAIDASSPIIPSSATSQFGTLGDLEDLERSVVASGVALGGLATSHSFYVTGFLALGLGYQNLRAHFTTVGRKRISSLGNYNSLRFGAGYNGQTHVAGLQLIGDYLSTSLADGQIRGNTFELKFFYAYRFQDVRLGFLDSLSDWMSGIAPSRGSH